MIVILGSRFDPGLKQMADQWKAHDPRVMTARDLSKPGWKDPVAWTSSGGAAAVIGGTQVSLDEIKGVLVRMPTVLPQELGHIVAEDREYVAAEITAYLVSWLSRLKCPVLNRPRPMCLSGPAWHHEKWLDVAIKLGIPVIQYHRSSLESKGPDPRGDAPQSVIVVNNQCFGTENDSISKSARLLAKEAGVNLLGAYFVGSAFAGANPWPALDSVEVNEAVLEFFVGHHPILETQA